MSKCECGGVLDSYIRNGETITTCTKCSNPAKAKPVVADPVTLVDSPVPEKKGGQWSRELEDNLRKATKND
jgi:hypothetical protein